jgi:glycosyltransferase involved in cell wall biosynthesis
MITCTYNPNPKIFERVLRSVEHQLIEDFNFEYIIVDNNSNPPVSEMPCVHAFLERHTWARVITEKKQGLSYARIAGVVKLFNQYYFVGVWGAGDITVEFPEGVPLWVEKDMKAFFLEYTTVVDMYSPAYPIGGGMAVKRELMTLYNHLVQNPEFKTTGRKADSGASWDDTQINWLAIKNGFAVGVSPDLKYNHLIPQKRTSIDYICKQTFDGIATGLTAFYEIFPDLKQSYEGIKPSKRSTFLLRFFKLLITMNFNSLKIHIAGYFGGWESYYRGHRLTRPTSYRLFASLFLPIAKLRLPED